MKNQNRLKSITPDQENVVFRSKDEAHEFVITIDDDGNYYVNGERCTPKEAVEALAGDYMKQPDSSTWDDDEFGFLLLRATQHADIALAPSGEVRVYGPMVEKLEAMADAKGVEPAKFVKGLLRSELEKLTRGME